MPKEILDYIQTQRICGLAVEMLDGSPHAATVHFAFDEKTNSFLVKTHKEYRKVESLLEKGKTRASIVIGFTEEEMKTFQADGIAEYVNDKLGKNEFGNVYYAKFPEKERDDEDSEAVYIRFTPTWWRFTDWKTPTGKLILTSTDK